MRSYKEIADIVREQGDAILERRKIRAQRIKKISCAVSGLCAALIICAAVWNNSALQKAPDLCQSHIEPVTEASSVTTEKASEVTSALTSTVGTTAAKTTVQTTAAVTASSAAHTTANTVQTTPISSAATDSPVTTGSTVTTNSPTITSTVQVSAVSTTDTGAIEVMPVTTTRPHGNNTSTDEGISTQNTKETVIIVPVSTTVPEITVPTTQSITTTTKALVMTETTSATDGSAITTSAQVISDPGTVIVEAPDEETIKKYFNEISFNGRTYSYSCTVSEPTPELTDYMPFESYKLRAAGESEDKIITATAVLYMPEEGEKDHVWLKFDKKSEYCLYTEAD